MRAIGIHNCASRLLLLTVGLLCTPLAIRGDDGGIGAPPVANEPPRPPMARDTPIRGYCGLYCLHAAMQSLGRNVDFAGLVSPRYLGSRRGSTIAELSLAAEDHDMHVMSMTHLSCNLLRSVDLPLLLNVRSKLSGAEYDHWVLFLGTSANQVRLYDSGVIKTVSMQHLAGAWNGVGLFVSDRPIDATAVYLSAVNWLLVVASACVFLDLGILRHVRALASPWNPSRGPRVIHRVLAQAGILFIGAMALIGVMSLSFAGGYLSSQEVVAAVQERHIADLTPDLSINELEAALADPEVLLVDARHAGDFSAGHIPGAVNFPADSSATSSRLLERFGKHPRSARVVIYCQSAGCSYDEHVANLFFSNGYTNIAMYSGGWRQWQEQHPWQK